MEDIEVQFANTAGVDGRVTVNAERLVVGGVTFYLHASYRVPKLPPHELELMKGFRAISRAGLHMHTFRLTDDINVKEYIRELIRKQCGTGKDFKPEKLMDMFLVQFKRYIDAGLFTPKDMRLEERALRQELKLD